MSLFRSSYIRYIIRKMRLPNDTENIATTMSNIREGSVMKGASLWVLVCAIFIASLGLNTNSTAVIIGAMLISPLMGPIMGFGLGLGINDLTLVKQSTRNFFAMVGISVITSTVFFLISPVKEAGSELLGRTSPTVYDVLVAFFGGIAGIIAGATKLRKSNVIPGVAIATALMPPLCTMGYGISNLNWQYALGAFYLFLINCVIIGISTYLIVSFLGYPKVNNRDKPQRKRITWIISLILLLMIAPSIYITYHLVKKSFYRQNAEMFISKEILDPSHIVITSKLDYKPSSSRLELVLMGERIDSAGLKVLEGKMKDYGLKNCDLIVYQGTDSREAAKGIFAELSTDMKLHDLSIKELYIRMDSLQRALGKVALLDSLQRNIAIEMKSIDSSLQDLAIDRSYRFNPERNGSDTLWTLNASFNGGLNAAKKTEIENWLYKRLGTSRVKLIAE